MRGTSRAGRVARGDQAPLCRTHRTGLGLGKALLAAVTDAAASLGHGALCLDTLLFMAKARALYLAAGFRPIPPYYDSPVPGTVFLGKALP